MNKRKIVFIAQFPPPIHGLSEAVSVLFNSDIKNKFLLKKINTTVNRAFLKNLFMLITSNADIAYLTLSQTKLGNIRDLLFMIVAIIKHQKLVLHLHGGYYRTLLESELGFTQKYLNYKVLRKSSCVIVLGKSLRHIFDGIVSNEVITEVPNCVDKKYVMNKHAFKNKIDNIKRKHTIHVLYLSNFIKSKGYLEIIECAKLALNELDRDEIHFDFAGKFFTEFEKKEFEKFVRDNHLQNIVTYHGIVTGTKKIELLKSADIFMLPTRYPKEGQPISIIEAMANGCYIVTTRFAGIPDLFPDNKQTGVLLDPYRLNGETLFGTINKVIRDPEAWKDAVSINWKRSMSEYSKQKYIQNMDSCFERVILTQ